MVDFVRIRKLQEQEARLKWMVIKAEARATRSTTSITGMPRGGGSGNMQEDRMVELEAMYPSYRFVDCKVFYSDQLDGVYIRAVMRRRRA